MTPGRFLSPLLTEHRGPRRKRLLAQLVYVDRTGRTWVVPAGFESDGASVPRFLWWLYPPFGEAYEPATWLHDHLYAKAEACFVTGADGAPRPIRRGEADALMREASTDGCGFRGRGAAVMHAGVRSGGWLPWRRYRAAAAANQLATVGNEPKEGTA